MHDALFCSPKGLLFFRHNEQFWQVWTETAGISQVALNWKLAETEEPESKLGKIRQNFTFPDQHYWCLTSVHKTGQQLAKCSWCRHIYDINNSFSIVKLKNSLPAAGAAYVSRMPHSPVLCSGSPELHGSLAALTVPHVVLSDGKWGQAQGSAPWSLSYSAEGLYPLLSSEQYSFLFKKGAKACPSGTFEFLRSPDYFALCQRLKETKISCEALCSEGKQLNLPIYDSVLHQLCQFAVEKADLCVRGWAEFRSVRSAKWGMQLGRSLMSTDLMKGFNGAHLQMKKESNREARPIVSLLTRQSILPWQGSG